MGWLTRSERTVMVKAECIIFFEGAVRHAADRGKADRVQGCVRESTNPLRLTRSHGLLVTQSHNGIELRGAPGRIDAEEEAHGHGDGKGDGNPKHRYLGR